MLGWMHWLAHVDWPVPEAKPGSQFEHDVAPPAEYVPAAHGEHPLEDVAPELLREVPGAHAVAPPCVPTYPVPMQ
jgi:hypothetical protein